MEKQQDFSNWHLRSEFPFHDETSVWIGAREKVTCRGLKN
jgi:hypothetical protein